MTSWITSANTPENHFPIQNLPFGVASIAGRPASCVTAIGDSVVDLAALEKAGLVLEANHMPVFAGDTLNAFMDLGREAWDAVRADLTALLSDSGNPALKNNDALCNVAIAPMADATMLLPIKVSEYTDFYAGMQHAKNMGAILRGSESLPANWLHIPIGYNGRASSVVVSGTDIHRPWGQIKAPDAEMPSFAPTKRLDIELEIGAIVGKGSALGRPVSVAQADEMIFGYVLLNDWSARDIQGWEYQPLGPFQGKAFGTSISPWIVTAQALEAFRTSVPPREVELLPYLAEEKPGLYDITLEVQMQPEGAQTATTLSRTNYSRMYYSAAQQLCHHSIGGCKMNAGDLLGSGTISGPDRSEFGSLMELSWAGREPFTLDTGEKRGFIEDGDRLTLTGYAQGDGFRVGFGECTGRILPAIDKPEWG